MNKGLSLYFAIMGTLLLVAFAGSLSFRNAGVSIAILLLTIAHLGLGFMIKARSRRKLVKNQATGPSSE